MSPPKTLTPEQSINLINILLTYHNTVKQSIKACRNGSMAIIMLETGLRVGEMCGLIKDDLWYMGQPVECLVVRKEIAKNKTERQVPISHKLTDTICMMHESVWSTKEMTGQSYAFYAQDPARKMSTRTVERIILAAGRTAFNIVVTPHMLRHTFASRMMRKTNSRIVQSLLGHSSLQSTQVYMHPNSKDLKDAINSND